MQGNESKSLKIALDAMGGDFAPLNEIKGAVLAFKDNKNIDLEIVFVGKTDIIESTLKSQNIDNLKYSIHHAEDVVAMHDDPTEVIKKKRKSSLYVGMELLKNKEVDAFVSAGNTGAMMSTATILLGRIQGVSRPTIGTYFPTVGKSQVLILDVGATVDSKSRFLFEYGVMGDIYTKIHHGIEKPRIGLLNVGEEKSKGTEVVKETYKLLEESNLNFIGNVEGRDIFQAKADVIVCDGFTGNIVLKFAESMFSMLKSVMKEYASESLINKIKLGLMKPTLKEVLSDLDYQKYGGVPLLGVNGAVIIGHGSSGPLALSNMINEAIRIVNKNLITRIEKAIGELKKV